MLKKSNLIITLLTLLIIFFYILCLVLHWEEIKPNVYNVSISDFFNNTITLFIGIIVSFVFGVKHSNKQKRVEEINKILDMYIDDLRTLMKIINKSRKSLNNLDYNEILHLLRMASKDLHTYLKMAKTTNSKKQEEKHKNNFRDLRKTLTEKEFKNKETLNNSYYNIFNCYYQIKNDVMFTKFCNYE